MKFRVFIVMMLLFSLVFTGCGQGKPATNDNQAGQEQPNQEGTKSEGNESSDVVTTASIVNDGEALANALGENGKFITAILQNMTLDKDLVVVGNTHNKDDAAQPLYRKLALYTQDEDHKIIDSFTLTVPKIIVKSENFKIQGGTLKGDVYVEANGFSLHETATVDGNIYFANEEYQASAVFDGKVTGKTEIGTNPDVVTTASIVNEGEALTYALGVNGRFITAILQDLTLDKDLVVVGNTHNKDDAAQPLYRKLALYTQDEDHKIIDSFTLTVPKIIVKSENFKIQGGTLKGDVYVEANGFSLHETATVDGNIYFANEEFKASAVFDGKVTGKTEIGTKPDAVTTASIVNDGNALAYALGEKGRFITAILQDLTLDKDLVVVGNTHNKDDAAQPLYRKLALYTQNANHQITESFTLTVPNFNVKSENFKIQGGTLKGNVNVEANGFTLDKTATVDGNIYFANKEYQASAAIDGTVTGSVKVK